MRATALVPANVSVWHEAQRRPTAACAPFFDRSGLSSGFGCLRRRQRGEIGAEIADVFIVDLLDDRLHLLVLARAAAEEHQLPLNELIRLARQRGNVLGLRNAVFAVTAGAEFGLFLAGGDDRRRGPERWRCRQPIARLSNARSRIDGASSAFPCSSSSFRARLAQLDISRYRRWISGSRSGMTNAVTHNKKLRPPVPEQPQPLDDSALTSCS